MDLYEFDETLDNHFPSVIVPLIGSFVVDEFSYAMHPCTLTIIEQSYGEFNEVDQTWNGLKHNYCRDRSGDSTNSIERNWFAFGRYHREGAAARIIISGTIHKRYYYYHGLLQNIHGPAVHIQENIFSKYMWYDYGLQHRDKGPAVIYVKDGRGHDGYHGEYRMEWWLDDEIQKSHRHTFANMREHGRFCGQYIRPWTNRDFYKLNW